MAEDTRKKNKRGPRRREKPEFDNKLLDLARVTRVVKGGRRFRFRATVVLGNRKGRVGLGVAKGTDVAQAIQKASDQAKKKMITVVMDGSTITHDTVKKLGAAKIILKPASKGRGIIAGGAVRTVLDLAGVRDVVSKSLGTSNKINVARATIEALSEMKSGKENQAKPAARAKATIAPKTEKKDAEEKVTEHKENKKA